MRIIRLSQTIYKIYIITQNSALWHRQTFPSSDCYYSLHLTK